MEKETCTGKRHRKSVLAKEMCKKRPAQEKILEKRDIFRNRKRVLEKETYTGKATEKKRPAQAKRYEKETCTGKET